MLLPDKMSKILIVGSKERLKDAIDTLYSVEYVHPIDPSPDEEGIDLGSPLPSASGASQKLLKLRALEKDLDITGEEETERIDVSRIHQEIDSALADLESDISAAVEEKMDLQAKAHEIENRKKLLEPLKALPLDLDLYHGYKRLDVFTGTVRLDPEAQIAAAVKNYDLFKSEEGDFVALFVSKDESAEAQKILIQSGFSEVPAPVGTGSPMAEIGKMDSEHQEVQKRLEESAKNIDALREKHKAFILASEEELGVVVEKAEFPLRTSTTKHAFVLDAWAPSEKVGDLRKTISERIGDDVFVEELETMPRREHLHPEESHAGVSREHVHETAPTRADHKNPVGMFNGLTKLLSVPKYNEIDPTLILSITFPIFFGLMVGDIGYGIPFMILGVLGLKHCKSQDWRTIATMLLFGGIWATVFGLFLFGEAFGMHFSPKEGEITWSALLGTELPHIGILSKLHDVKLILYITVWIGLIHLFVGFVVGVYNETIRHGFKTAFFHKVGWVMILVGGAFLMLYVVDLLILKINVPLTDPRFLVGLGFILPGIVVTYIGEGGQAILELPTLMSNVISYTRLAAIGMSKAGMALAFNMMAIEMIGAGGGAMIVAAVAVFMIGHLMIFILAVITAGIHGIRLHYVEMFQKFYVGGGLEFNPLKIIRKYTNEGR